LHKKAIFLDWILDAHCHTVASGHAYSTVCELCEAASAKGLSLVAITDHAPAMPGVYGFYQFLNFGIMPKTIAGVRLCSGVELNIMDTSGTVDLEPYVLQGLDVVIASLHFPCFPPGTEAENTEAVINTMQNPYVNIIGHLGDPRYPIDVDAIVTAAVRYSVILEVNNASVNPKGFRSGGDATIVEIMKKCKARDWPVILGSDAHYKDDVGNFAFVKPLIKEADIPHSLILNSSVDLFEKFVLHKSR
jgi:putative hydrolase